MGRLRSVWQKAKKPLKVFCITAVCMLVIAPLVVSILTYIFNWNVPGIHGKNLWDWMQLFFIPAAIAFGVLWLSRLQQQRDQKLADQRDKSEREATEKRAETEREIAEDNQREAALQAYLDKMSELLLEKHLRELKPEYEEARQIARVRTLTVLPRLNGKRKAIVIKFLYESGLINKEKTIIYLSGADLREVDLSSTSLRGANLSGTCMEGIKLIRADLVEADLSDSDLTVADLRRAELEEADLHECSLTGVNLHRANLSRANLSGSPLVVADLRGANLSGANLSKVSLYRAILSVANLSNADLSEADLTRTKVTDEQLNAAKSLKGATMPDGTKHA